MSAFEKKILPRYSWAYLIAAALCNTLCYFGTRLVTTGRHHILLDTMLDDRIPLCTFFIVFYFLAYVQWIASYVFIAREGRAFCYDLVMGDIIAKLICGILFILVPTTLVRPEITGTGIFDQLCRFLYRIDAADNLFPSIHCLESYMALRAAFMMKKMPSWYKPFTLVFSLLVFASTVLLKQHLLIDIAGGIIVAEVGIQIAEKTKVGRMVSPARVKKTITRIWP